MPRPQPVWSARQAPAAAKQLNTFNSRFELSHYRGSTIVTAQDNFDKDFSVLAKPTLARNLPTFVHFRSPNGGVGTEYMAASFPTRKAAEAAAVAFVDARLDGGGKAVSTGTREAGGAKVSLVFCSSIVQDPYGSYAVLIHLEDGRRVLGPVGAFATQAEAEAAGSEILARAMRKMADEGYSVRRPHEPKTDHEN